MNKPSKNLTIYNSLPPHIDDNTILNIIAKSVTYSTHGFHKYPAKYIPHIPKWAIDKYLANKQNKIILDPFCGSGTTLVESILAGHNSLGLDIDPLSVLISKVKTKPININLIYIIKDWIFHQMNNNPRPLFIPECKTIDHWFTIDTFNKLSNIRTHIDSIIEKFGDTDDVNDIKQLFLICFSSIIRRVSNADNESQKTYVSHRKIKKPAETYELFSKQLNYYVDRIVSFTNGINQNNIATVINGNSTYLLSKQVRNEKFDLAITSPPYIKAIDYIYNQMVELFWIGDLFGINTQEKQNLHKKNYVGTKQVHKVEYNGYSPDIYQTNIPELDLKLKEVFNNDPKNGHKHSYITYKYFTEIDDHFCEMSKCLKSKSHYIVVVGNSEVSNVFFNTAIYFKDLAVKHGFNLKNIWAYKIKNRFMRFNRNGRGGLIELDWVLDFEKK